MVSLLLGIVTSNLEMLNNMTHMQDLWLALQNCSSIIRYPLMYFLSFLAELFMVHFSWLSLFIKAVFAFDRSNLNKFISACHQSPHAIETAYLSSFASWFFQSKRTKINADCSYTCRWRRKLNYMYMQLYIPSAYIVFILLLKKVLFMTLIYFIAPLRDVFVYSCNVVAIVHCTISSKQVKVCMSF